MWIRIGRVAVFLWVAGLAVIYSSLWVKTIHNPNELNFTDFSAFYAAGRIAQAQGYSAIYDISLQKNVVNEVQGMNTDGFLLYNHLPYFVPVIAWTADADYQASFIRWVLVMLCVYLGAVYLFIRSLFPHEPLVTRLMLAGGMLTFLPVFISLWQGQDTSFLFLGVTLWCVGMLKKQGMLAAIGLVLVTVRPHLFLALAIPLLFRDRNVLWRLVILGAVTGIYSLLLIGIRGMTGFITLLRISAEGKWFGMNPQNMPNLTGLIFRSISLDHDTLNLASWIIFGVGMMIITLIWLRSKVIHSPILGLSILIATMTAPHLHLHDLAIWTLPLVFVISHDHQKALSPLAIMALPVASVVFLSGRMVGALEFIVPYLVFLALTVGLAFQSTISSAVPETTS